MLSASCGVEPSPGRALQALPRRGHPALGAQARATASCCNASSSSRSSASATSTGPTSSPATAASRGRDRVTVAATDPLYILYTSGTTGKPKGIYRDSGGYAVALRWSMANLYDVAPGETMFTASDVGWVVGHSYIVYAPLLTGATTVLYEGKPVGTPDAGAFWRVIAEYGAVVPLHRADGVPGHQAGGLDGVQLVADHDLSRFRTLFLAGERLDPDTYEWASAALGMPVIDNWWQTETGWPIAANPQGIELLPIKPGSPTVAGAGLRRAGARRHGSSRSTRGSRARSASSCRCRPGRCRRCGATTTATSSSYLSAYPGYYLTGDGGYVDEDGYLYVMGRTDDVLNVAGHRLSTGSIEAALAGHEAVAECAVIGVHDELKGQVPRALVVLKSGVDGEADGERIRRELVARVRDEVGRGRGAAPGRHRGRPAQDAVGQDPAQDDARDRRRQDARPCPATIEDASVLDTLAPVLRGPTA